MEYLQPEHYEQAEAIGVSRHLLSNRVYQQFWDIERAVTTPPRRPLQFSEHWLAVAEQNGIDRDKFRHRVYRGWDEERAATVSSEEAIKRARGKLRTVSPEDEEKAAELGLSRQTVRYRLKKGWSLEDAITTPLIPPSQRKTVGKQRQKEGRR